jgi:hypothetical protein
MGRPVRSFARPQVQEGGLRINARGVSIALRCGLMDRICGIGGENLRLKGDLQR